MNSPDGVARVLLIADDPDGGLRYREALAAGGYQVVQAESFLEAFDSSMIDPDVIVLCELAMFAYPAQNAQVLRIPDRNDAGRARGRGAPSPRAARRAPRHHRP